MDSYHKVRVDLKKAQARGNFNKTMMLDNSDSDDDRRKTMGAPSKFGSFLGVVKNNDSKLQK